MNILLDACSFLWALEEPERLSEEARRVFAQKENRLFLSAVTVWEIALKYRLERLHLPAPPSVTIPRAMRDLKLTSLDLDISSAMRVASLPLHHKDPFDRMLVCQSLCHDMAILTPDALIKQYAVPCIW